MKKKLVLLILVLLIGVWSAVNVEDTYLTWLLESFPVWIGIAVLFALRKKLPFNEYVYSVMTFHAVVLLVGAHYSYAKVPLGFWMEDWFGFERNNYDKIGHFMQGVTPTLLTMSLLINTYCMKPCGMMKFLSFSVAMMVSAVYEIIEWAASLSNPTDTEAFLGTQGYIWDTQSDMFMCMLGSLFTLLLCKFFPILLTPKKEIA